MQSLVYKFPHYKSLHDLKTQGTSQDIRNNRVKISDDTTPYAFAKDILIVALKLQAPATKFFNFCLKITI